MLLSYVTNSVASLHDLITLALRVPPCVKYKAEPEFFLWYDHKYGEIFNDPGKKLSFLDNKISLVCIPPIFLLPISSRVVLLMKFQQQQNHNHKKCLLWHCTVANSDLGLSSNLYLRKYHRQGQAGLTSAASFTLFL